MSECHALILTGNRRPLGASQGKLMTCMLTLASLQKPMPAMHEDVTSASLYSTAASFASEPYGSPSLLILYNWARHHLLPWLGLLVVHPAALHAVWMSSFLHPVPSSASPVLLQNDPTVRSLSLPQAVGMPLMYCAAVKSSVSSAC